MSKPAHKATQVALTRAEYRVYNRAVAAVLRVEFHIDDPADVWVTALVREFARSGESVFLAARALVVSECDACGDIPARCPLYAV